MDNFLDTCVIIDNFNEKSNFHDTSKSFIVAEKDFIISEFQKKQEIPFLLYRMKLKTKIIISKALMPNKEICQIKKLTPRDKREIKEILSEYALGLKSIKDLYDLRKEVFFLEKKLNSFIETQISRLVTSTEKIDRLLAKDVEKLNNNFQDSMVIASAIQEHQQNKLILPTTDKND